jgi:hypothetical protein
MNGGWKWKNEKNSIKQGNKKLNWVDSGQLAKPAT